ncbi:hypothetical protein [Methanosarcina mazei]|nr:hypothetical protein [Methanosarcina mazei]
MNINSLFEKINNNTLCVGVTGLDYVGVPLDPFYMFYQAKKYGIIPRFIETSGEITNFMKVHTINLIKKGLQKVNKNIYGSTITVTVSPIIIDCKNLFNELDGVMYLGIGKGN